MAAHLSTQTLEAYHQGRLRPGELLELDDHLAVCAECREILRETKERTPALLQLRANLDARPEPAWWDKIRMAAGSFQLTAPVLRFAGATALGVFILRKKMPDAPRPYKVWGYPIVPAIVILISAGLFINTIATRPREAGIGLILMLTGVPMWFWFNRKSKFKSKK